MTRDLSDRRATTKRGRSRQGLGNALSTVRGRLTIGVRAGESEEEFRVLRVGDRFHHRGVYLDEMLRLWTHLWYTPETPVAVSSTMYLRRHLAYAQCKLGAAHLGWWLVRGSTLSGLQSWRGLASAGISQFDLATHAMLVQRSAMRAHRSGPRIAPRPPVQLGAASEALSVGRMHSIPGSPNDVVAQLRAYAETGTSEIVCHFNSPDGNVVVEQLEMLAEQAMPVLSTATNP